VRCIAPSNATTRASDLCTVFSRVVALTARGIALHALDCTLMWKTILSAPQARRSRRDVPCAFTLRVLEITKRGGDYTGVGVLEFFGNCNSNSNSNGDGLTHCSGDRVGRMDVGCSSARLGFLGNEKRECRRCPSRRSPTPSSFPPALLPRKSGAPPSAALQPRSPSCPQFSASLVPQKHGATAVTERFSAGAALAAPAFRLAR
jgi:hypothetical protein